MRRELTSLLPHFSDTECGVDATLTLAGPIMTERARREIEAAGLEFNSALILLGPVAGTAKDAFFGEIDIFLFPSRYRFEAQPLVVLEAMAHGCAPIVSHAGFTVELVGDHLPTVANLVDYPERVQQLCSLYMESSQKLEQISRIA